MGNRELVEALRSNSEGLKELKPFSVANALLLCLESADRIEQLDATLKKRKVTPTTPPPSSKQSAPTAARLPARP